MPDTATQGRVAHGALECLALVCRLHHRPVSLFQLRHRFETGNAELLETDLLRAARSEYAKLEKPLTESEIGGWV